MSRPFTILTLLLSLAAAPGCGQSQAPAAGAAALPPTDVQTKLLEAAPVPQASEYVATIRSLRSTTIQPQVDGLVRQILVRAGDRVQPGQALVQIDPDRQEALVGVSESQRAARQADLELAEQQLRRIRTLHQAGAVSRADLDSAESAQKNAAAQLAAVQSQIRESQVELRYYRVTAPTAGIVNDISIRPGDRVTTGTVITTLDQAEGLEVYLNVPLERATGLRPGLPIELLDSGGMVVATSAVTFIAPRADDATQSVLVKGALRTMPPGLRILQYVRARLVWNRDPALTVPILAVSRLAGQHFVFVAEAAGEGFVARQKPVTIGDVIGDDYVVRSGLAAGERVIVSNIQKIGDGAPVKPS